MDELKKHIRKIEHRLNVEEISPDVWLNIKNKLDLKDDRTMVRQPLNWSTIFNLRKPGWAITLSVFILILASFAIRVRNVRSLGNLVSFSALISDKTAFNSLSSLDSLLGLNLIKARNVQPYTVSFVGFIKETETGKLESVLKTISQFSGKIEFLSIPVKIQEKESLFSKAVFKLFKKHLDLKSTNTKDVTTDLNQRLNNAGIKDVNLKLVENNLTISTGNIQVPGKLTEPARVDSGNLKEPVITRIDSAKILTPSISFTKPEELDRFSWILHTWKTRDSSLNTFHRWVRINDSVYRSFLIRLEPVIKIQPGYFLIARDGSTHLGKEENNWKLDSAVANQFYFQRESQQFPYRILWVQSGKNWRFDLIRGSLKDQTQLYIDDINNPRLDSVINDYRSKNPSLFK